MTGLTLGVVLAHHAMSAETLSIQPAYALPQYTKLNLGTNENSAFRAFYGLMALGDFNEDGRKDAAVMLIGNWSGPGLYPLGLSIQLQNADGSITRKAEYTLPNTGAPWQIVVDDFNEDDHLDIIVTDYGHDMVMLFGDGDGTFQEPTFMGLGACGFPVAAHLDGDTHLDLVAGALDGTVAVFSGWGDGSFTRVASLPSSVNAYERSGQSMVGDVNRDGKQDVAVAADINFSGDGSLDIYFGNGDGTFQNVVQTPGVAVWCGALGDFNGDGLLDYAGDRFSPEQVEMWLGQGDGHFTRSDTHSLSGLRPDFVHVADLNHDGIQDVVVSGETSDTVFIAPLSIFLGKGDGTFRPRQLWTPLKDFYIYNVGPRLADFNGDGLLDIVSVPRHGVGDLTVVGPRVFAVALNPGRKPSLDAGFMLTVRNDETNAAGSVVLESSANLTDWNPLATNSVVTTWPFVDTSAVVRPRSFYRTRRQQTPAVLKP